MTPAMITREKIIELLNDPITFNIGGVWDDLGEWDGQNPNWFVYVGGKFDDYNNCVVCYDTGGNNNDGDCGYSTIQIKCRSTAYQTAYMFLDALKLQLDAVENYQTIVGYEIIGDINDIGQDTMGRYECTLNVEAIKENI